MIIGVIVCVCIVVFCGRFIASITVVVVVVVSRGILGIITFVISTLSNRFCEYVPKIRRGYRRVIRIMV